MPSAARFPPPFVGTPTRHLVSNSQAASADLPIVPWIGPLRRFHRIGMSFKPLPELADTKLYGTACGRFARELTVAFPR